MFLGMWYMLKCDANLFISPPPSPLSLSLPLKKNVYQLNIKDSFSGVSIQYENYPNDRAQKADRGPENEFLETPGMRQRNNTVSD